MSSNAHRYLPHPAMIARILPESVDTRTFVLRPDPPAPVFEAARPGQFAMLSIFGHGEAAFTFSSLPRAGAQSGSVVVTVRRVGSLTGRLFELSEGDCVGLRGPFGRGFPDDRPGEPTLYVAGGCGLSPLKAAIEVQLAERPPGTQVAILYGAREANQRIHRAALESWRVLPTVTLIECLEHASPGWSGRLGVVGDYLDEAIRKIAPRRVAICGPPAMMAPIAHHARRAGLDPERIFLAIERVMRCGMGECGHCYVNHRYVCTDGPVFSLDELLELPDAFSETTRPADATC